MTTTLGRKPHSRIIIAEVVEGLRQMPAGAVDLTVTSPPYDGLRDYHGTKTFNVHLVAAELQRVTRPGGVVVWIVGDQVINGSESCSSFRHALAFRECGWRLHDTMIYQRFSRVPDANRYYPTFEYMFVFSLGKPKTFHPIMDRRSKSAGQRVRGTERQRDGTLKFYDRGNTVPSVSRRTNIWCCPAGSANNAPDPRLLRGVRPSRDCRGNARETLDDDRDLQGLCSACKTEDSIRRQKSRTLSTSLQSPLPSSRRSLCSTRRSMTRPTVTDEIEALQEIALRLIALDPQARRRVLQWIVDRFQDPHPPQPDPAASELDNAVTLLLLRPPEPLSDPLPEEAA